jgi:ubiquitin-conjugating enzyme E2 Q
VPCLNLYTTDFHSPQPDTSSYPQEHTCFAYDQESDGNETVSEVLESLSSSSAKPLKETILRMVGSISSALGLCEDEDMEDGTEDNISVDSEGMDQYQASHVAQQTLALKRDFLEVVAADWRPGLIRFGSNEFGVSLLSETSNDSLTSSQSCVSPVPSSRSVKFL